MKSTSICLGLLMVWMAPSPVASFIVTTPSVGRSSCSTRLHMGYSAKGRSSPRYGKERSKRQERVGHLVRTELSQIIHTGLIKGDPDVLGR